ncbi:plasmid stabilization protein [Trabulsiella odontotermitis]|nr:plasmid stabilization protein [Trabulsiella odontotermitis]
MECPDYTLRYTLPASEDLIRLYGFLLDKENADLCLAQKALDAIECGVGQLAFFPYNCRKVLPNNPYLRELIIPFGGTGYIAMFEIDPLNSIVTILAVRHQREDDYH